MLGLALGLGLGLPCGGGAGAVGTRARRATDTKRPGVSLSVPNSDIGVGSADDVVVSRVLVSRSIISAS